MTDSKNNKPFFSVIIPLYNKEKHIKNTLKSVLHQTFTNYEIVIINDGSTDNSESVVKNFTDPRIKYFNQENQGASQTRNNGIKYAIGKYYALLDADDLWFPNHLENFKKSISKYSTHLIFCNNYRLYFSSKNTRNASFSYLPKEEEDIVVIKNYFRSSLHDSIANSTAICLHHSIFEKGYFFDPTIPSGQDTVLWIQLAINFEYIFNKTITSEYNKSITNSLSKSKNADSRKTITSLFIANEKKDVFLKKYIDQNRFSIAVEYKINNQLKEFKELKSQIKKSNLNRKQLILLILPSFFLRYLFITKKKLEQLGVNLSVFK